MMTLANLSLLDLQPEFLRSDPVTVALCRALDPVFRSLSDELKGLLIYTNIDNLPGEILDEIAWGFDIDWYDSSGTLAERRKTVKNAFSIFRRRGTVSAIKDAVAAGFGDARVEEWFKYSGDPGKFRIIVEDPSATAARAAAFLAVVERVKNVRSHCESITIMSTSPGPVYIGSAPVVIKYVRSETIG